MPRGVPQIEVIYELDANGILTVSASEKSSGKQQKITITNDKERLTKEQIDEMIKKAEQLKEEDENNYKRVESKNSLESYVYNWRNQLDNQELTSKLDASEVEKAKQMIKDMQQWLDSNTTATAEEYDHKRKECEQYFNQLAKNLYGQAGGTGEMPDMSQFANMAGNGGMPDMSQFAEMMKNAQSKSNTSGGDSSPQVDEVD